MGMAASQARLLSLTARIHDVEYESQTIQNAKLALATQSDSVYQEYQEALDATSLTFSTINPQSGVTSTIVANFNNLFSVNRARSATGKEYALRDRHGRVVVEESLYNGYKNYTDNGMPDSAYAFALYMMGETDWEQYSGNSSSAQVIYQTEFNVYQNKNDDPTLVELRNHVLEANGTPASDYNDPNSYQAVYDTSQINNDPEKMQEYNEALAKYQKYLYSHYAEEINTELYNNVLGMNNPIDEFDKNLFDYYVQMYNVIKQCGGMICVDDYDGFNGDAKTDSDWLQAMIQSGEMSISIVKTDSQTGKVTLNGTMPSSDDNINYTTTSTIDSTALKKAEAEYEHATKLIDQKDKKFDLELSKLETERQALTKQYDATKTIIKDNEERTFGIFS